MDVPSTVLIIAGLLLMAGLAEPLAQRFRLPSTVLLAILGIAVAAGSAELLRSDLSETTGDMARAALNLPIGSAGFIYVFLPILLFQAALNIDVRQMAEDAAPVLTLAIVAVVVSTFAVGLAVWPFSGVPLVACLLLGAIVATTDPGAVIGVFRDAGAPKRLSRLVEGESLLNDAAAIVLFEMFVAQLVTAAHAEPVHLIVEFLAVPVGGALVGYGGARLCSLLFPLVRDNRMVLVSVTLALPFAAMVIASELRLSGFVAVVSAGITLAGLGPPRSTLDAWRYVRDIWEQLAFWASSLLFVLAAFLIPTLMGGLGIADLVYILIIAAAALAARAAVLYGVLPVMVRFRLSPDVSHAYRGVILWGGLRGAATLALALAVTEHGDVAPEVKRFVAVGATGFVLFTLFVQGTTLRPLMRWLKLDRLSALEGALHEHALALIARGARERVGQAAQSFGISSDDVESLTESHLAELLGPQSSDHEHSRILLGDRIALALAAMTSRESEIVLMKLNELFIAPQNATALLAHARRLLDATRSAGASGYGEEARAILRFTWQLRLAHRLHERLHVSGPFSSQLANRFETLSASRAVIEDLRIFTSGSIAPLYGAEVADHVEEIRTRRQDHVIRELDALRLQYPGYARELHRTLLIRSALQVEEGESNRLLDEGLISPEVHRVLFEKLAIARRQVKQRPMLDVHLDTRELARNFSLFQSCDEQHLDAIVALLTPLTAIPGRQIIRKGERGDACYFIASGAVEVDTGFSVVRLGRGDVFGELALVTGLPRQADVTAIAYCSLLRLSSRDFAEFLNTAPRLRQQVEALARTRLQVNAASTRADAPVAQPT